MTKILIDEATVQQVLGALENIPQADSDCDEKMQREDDAIHEAITALREALAEQPAQQEPVAWAVYWGRELVLKHSVHFEQETANTLASKIKIKGFQARVQPLYTSPQPAQQEPVAWLRKSDLVELRTCNWMRLGADSPLIWAPNAPDEPSPDMELVAVYTSPQPAQRTWVGLTADEVEEIFQKKLGYYPTIYAVEAKLKEKNT